MEDEERTSAERQEPVREDVSEETQRRASGTKTPPVGRSRPRRPDAGPGLRRALSSRRALREAILLHEVLGTPKGMEPPAR